MSCCKSRRIRSAFSIAVGCVLAAAETRFRVIAVAGQSLIHGFVGLPQRDIPAANGIIHVADSIIFPALPTRVTTTR